MKLLEYQEADKASKPAEKDIRWVERQAIYVSYAGIFPRPVLMPMVQEYWREIANSNDNMGKKISYVIYRISQEKQKTSVTDKGSFDYAWRNGCKRCLQLCRWQLH